MCDIVEYPPDVNENLVDEGPFEYYLLVRNKRSGRTWAMKIEDNHTLDVCVETKRFLDEEFGSDLDIQPNFCDRSAGAHFSARIITDKRPPDSAVVWSKKGFFLNGGY